MSALLREGECGFVSEIWASMEMMLLFVSWNFVPPLIVQSLDNQSLQS